VLGIVAFHYLKRQRGVCDSRKSELLMFVESWAQRGNPQQVIEAIEEFVEIAGNMTMILGKTKYN
jgi:hypothetical protein